MRHMVLVTVSVLIISIQSVWAEDFNHQESQQGPAQWLTSLDLPTDKPITPPTEINPEHFSSNPFVLDDIYCMDDSIAVAKNAIGDQGDLFAFVSVAQVANAASASEVDSDSPEYVIYEFYRLISFEAGERPDYDGIRKLLADDAVILVGAPEEGEKVLNADESVQRVKEGIEELGFADYGLQFTVKNIKCRTTEATASCLATVETSYPGLDIDPIRSTDLTALEKSQGRWLATATALFVEAPDVRLPSILSYPVVGKAPAPVKAPKYERALPFLAQSVIDLGYQLPKPFGVAVIPAWLRQDFVLRDLSISVNNGPTKNIDFIDYGDPWVENTTVQVKFDAWILPFLNAFAAVGALDGKGSIPLTIQGADLMDHLGLGGSCTGGPLQPELCVQTLNAEAQPEYNGTSFTIGTTLSAGWRQLFVAVPISYTWTDVNIVETTVEALNITPRVGVTGSIGSWGALSVFVGATYLYAEVELEGSVTFDTPNSGVPGIGDKTTIDYKITQENKDKWNGLVGFNWDISRKWSASAEAGFGGSRSNFISSFTFRF